MANAPDRGARFVIAYDLAATPMLTLELHVLGDDDGESSFSELHRFVVEFRGCDGEGRGAACSFGAGPRVEVESTLDAFCHSIFLGGAVRLHRPATGDRELLFVITLVPELGRKDRTSLGGTGLTRSFARFMSPGFTLKPGSDDHVRISGLLAHEHFHHWNGGIVRGHEETEGLGYWFSEGFTDFFTRRLMVRSGIWSVKQWLGEWNNCLANFTRNPAHTAPAERIAREFWSDSNVSALPYQRGAIVAALLDQEIRACNDGKQSLDDFMRDLAVDGALPPQDDAEVLFGPLFRLAQRPDSSGAATAVGAVGATVPVLELPPETSEAEARAEL